MPCSYRSRRNCPERRCRLRCLLRTSQTQKISCGYGRSGRTGKITFSVPLRSENIRQISCCTDYIRIRISALYLSSNIITTQLTAKGGTKKEVGRLRGREVKIISTFHLLIFSTSAFLLCDLCVFAVNYYSSLFTVNKPGG